MPGLPADCNRCSANPLESRHRSSDTASSIPTATTSLIARRSPPRRSSALASVSASRLRGQRLSADDHRESALWALGSISRGAISPGPLPPGLELFARDPPSAGGKHRPGQRHWLLRRADLLRRAAPRAAVLCLADACLARGWLNEQESRFAFEWGVLLQLGDDLQDLREDMRRGSETLFSRAAALGQPLDDLVIHLLNFSEHVGDRMDDLPNGDKKFKELHEDELAVSDRRRGRGIA